MRHFRRNQAKYPGLWRGCVGAWCPLLGPTGFTLRDWSGYKNHGTLTSMDPPTDWVGSGFGYALDFDGTNDRVACPRVSVSGNLTVCAWVYSRTIASGAVTIISECDSGGTQYDYMFAINRPAAKVLLGWGNNDRVASSSSLAANTWYHIAATRSGVSGAWTGKIYINGIEDATATSTVNPNGSTGNTSIGSLGSANVLYWNGQLDDVRLYARALHPMEISVLAKRRGIAYETKRRTIGSAVLVNRRRRILMGME